MLGKIFSAVSLLCAIAAVPCFAADEPAAAKADVAAPTDNTPPEGFVALFNGKDLTGWKGLRGAPLDNPTVRASETPERLEKTQKYANQLMKEHWSVKDGILVYDGKGKSLATEKDYGDFELYVDWKILKDGDSGVYLRGTPQVQIWDPASKVAAGLGSGGLYNNEKGPSKPTKVADKPIGEWNTFWIKMVGEKVWVKLNGEMVVDGVVMENYWLRSMEKARQKAEKDAGKEVTEQPVGPIYSTGQIELQNHRNPLYFKNIYIKELPAQK